MQPLCKFHETLKKLLTNKLFQCYYFLVCPGKYRMYLLSCKDKYLMVSVKF